jgi:signal transduction histidine kinase
MQAYLWLVACVCLATLALSGSLVHFQRNMLRRHIIETGNTVSSFLAESLKVGVFAENAAEIRAAIRPMLHDKEVVGVAVFNRDRVLLQTGRAAESANAVKEWEPDPSLANLDTLAASGGVTHQEEAKTFTFWRPVLADTGYQTAEGLYFNDPLPSGSQVLLGYVAVAVSKEGLRRGVEAIVARSASVGLGFLLVGSLVTYLVVRNATRPLRRLVKQVQAYGVPSVVPGEFDLLSETFSNLIERLDRSFATINELRLGLQQKVLERTKELSEANRELQLEVLERQRIEDELKRSRDDLERRVQERTAELESMYQKLLHSEKLSALGTLVASIAHEMNNPLSAIRGSIELLELQAAGARINTRMLHVAIQECDRIARLIRGMQDFYRPTRGEITETDLHEAIDTVLMLCRKDLTVRAIRVDTRYGEDVPKVRAVPDQIKQVVLNLLNNARDALGDGGTIEIETEVQADRVRLHFRDTGVGIDNQDLKYIFEPFFSTKTASNGTGLGLSITQSIVRRHGGEIEVESVVGQGTHFTVSLPICRAED